MENVTNERKFKVTKTYFEIQSIEIIKNRELIRKVHLYHKEILKINEKELR